MELLQLSAGDCWSYLQLAWISFWTKCIFQSKRFLCVLKSKSFPCYYKDSNKIEDPLKRFQGPVDPQGSCDKLLSTAPAVAQGCSMYSFLELGFVGFGSRWQHFVCLLKALEICTRDVCVYMDTCETLRHLLLKELPWKPVSWLSCAGNMICLISWRRAGIWNALWPLWLTLDCSFFLRQSWPVDTRASSAFRHSCKHSTGKVHYFWWILPLFAMDPGQ